MFSRLAVCSIALVGASSGCPLLQLGAENSTDWHCKELLSDKFFFYWKVQDEGGGGDENVTMALHARQHDGYMAIGFSENGGMKGADFIVVQPHNESCMIGDYWSDDYTTPFLDEYQHVICHNTSLHDNDFTAVFSRQAATNDPYDNPIKLHGVFQSLIWSLGASADFNMHTERGSLFVDFAAIYESQVDYSSRPDVENDEDLCAFTIGETELLLPVRPYRNGSHIVEDPLNPYLQVVFQLSDVKDQCQDNFFDGSEDQEFHLIWSDVILGADSGKSKERYLHHLLFFGCSQLPEFYPDATYMNGMDVENCGNFKTGWSPGMAPSRAPDDGGWKFGGPSGQIFRLEFHYYNPFLVSGVKASSGYEFVITKKLRQFDIGVLTVSQGVVPATIQPLERNVVFGPDVCHLDCMGNYSFREEVKIFTAMYHMHYAGISGAIEVIRDGENLGPMFHQGRFDFNHQRSYAPDLRLNRLKPNDKLLSFCSYGTLGTSLDTEFGFGTHEEMCTLFITYYPEQPLNLCFSHARLSIDWGTIALGAQLKRYHTQETWGWERKQKFYETLCIDNEQSDSLSMTTVKDLCEVCDQKFVMTVHLQDFFKSCAFLVAHGWCPRCTCVGIVGAQDWENGNCPVKSWCSDDDYARHISNVKKLKCEEFKAGTHYEAAIHCQISPNTSFIPQAVSTPYVWPEHSLPAMKLAFSIQPDECATHADCPESNYCVNGRLGFTPSSFLKRIDGEYYTQENPTRNVCRSNALCCKNVDAVGPKGEINDLYPCPEEAGCRTWSAKAYYCHAYNSSYFYCPSKNENGTDYCLDTSVHNCKDHCEPSSSLEGYEGGVRMCVRKSDKAKKSEFELVTDAPGSYPIARPNLDFLPSSASAFGLIGLFLIII